MLFHSATTRGPSHLLLCSPPPVDPRWIVVLCVLLQGNSSLSWSMDSMHERDVFSRSRSSAVDESDAIEHHCIDDEDEEEDDEVSDLMRSSTPDFTNENRDENSPYNRSDSPAPVTTLKQPFKRPKSPLSQHIIHDNMPPIENTARRIKASPPSLYWDKTPLSIEIAKKIIISKLRGIQPAQRDFLESEFSWLRIEQLLALDPTLLPAIKFLAELNNPQALLVLDRENAITALQQELRERGPAHNAPYLKLAMQRLERELTANIADPAVLSVFRNFNAAVEEEKITGLKMVITMHQTQPSAVPKAFYLEFMAIQPLMKKSLQELTETNSDQFQPLMDECTQIQSLIDSLISTQPSYNEVLRHSLEYPQIWDAVMHIERINPNPTLRNNARDYIQKLLNEQLIANATLTASESEYNSKILALQSQIQNRLTARSSLIATEPAQPTN